MSVLGSLEHSPQKFRRHLSQETEVSSFFFKFTDFKKRFSTCEYKHFMDILEMQP
jgi:hypothetical protein